MADNWKVISAILGILLLVSLFFNLRGGTTGAVTGTVSGQQAAQKAVTVLKDYVTPGSTLNIIKVDEGNGLYNVSLGVDSQVANVYVTKDGTMLFTNPLDLTSPPPVPEKQTANISDANLTGKPVEGNPNATTTIVEFSDFQCPFCGNFFKDTYPQLKQTYLDTGKAKLVFVNFPLESIHPYAEKAAEAGLCAYDQNKFWEMHDKMFQNQNALTADDLKKYAADLKLNTGQFNQCLDSGKYAQRVKDDFNLGQSLGVSGTPTFFINGKEISGAQPLSAFQQALGG